MSNATLEIDEDTLDITTLLKMGPMAPVSNTHPIYAALRRDHPVFETADMSATSTFLITRYADVVKVLKDDQLYSSDINQCTMGIVMGKLLLVWMAKSI